MRWLKVSLVVAGGFIALAAVKAVVEPTPPTPSPAAESGPAILERKEIDLSLGQKGAVVSVRGPLTDTQVAELAERERQGRYLVRVFQYEDGRTPGADKPLHLTECESGSPCVTRY